MSPVDPDATLLMPNNEFNPGANIYAGVNCAAWRAPKDNISLIARCGPDRNHSDQN